MKIFQPLITTIETFSFFCTYYVVMIMLSKTFLFSQIIIHLKGALFDSENKPRNDKVSRKSSDSSCHKKYWHETNCWKQCLWDKLRLLGFIQLLEMQVTQKLTKKKNLIASNWNEVNQDVEWRGLAFNKIIFEKEFSQIKILPQAYPSQSLFTYRWVLETSVKER